ncbi:MAG: hypothetical protein N2C14_24525, partial [Planctomycetales bacterium]
TNEQREFYTNIVYCPNCDEVREADQFEFLGLVQELGNIPRFRCKICSGQFETLPPSVDPGDDQDSPVG